MRPALVIAAWLALASPAQAQSTPTQPKATHLVLVYEDAKLFTEADLGASHARAGDRVLPRATRPFVLVASGDDWVAIQSFSTADVGRFPICPLPGLTDLQVRLYVRPDDIADTIALSSLPKRASAILEFQTDPCRNPNARPITEVSDGEDPAALVPDLEAPLVGMGEYLPPRTKLFWPNGEGAGRTRFSVALPLQTVRHGSRSCFERDLQATGFTTSSRQGSLTFCYDRDEVQKASSARVRTRTETLKTY